MLICYLMQRPPIFSSLGVLGSWGVWDVCMYFAWDGSIPYHRRISLDLSPCTPAGTRMLSVRFPRGDLNSDRIGSRWACTRRD